MTCVPAVSSAGIGSKYAYGIDGSGSGRDDHDPLCESTAKATQKGPAELSASYPTPFAYASIFAFCSEALGRHAMHASCM